MIVETVYIFETAYSQNTIWHNNPDHHQYVLLFVSSSLAACPTVKVTFQEFAAILKVYKLVQK
jgi:hypothetical protein